AAVIACDPAESDPDGRCDQHRRYAYDEGQAPSVENAREHIAPKLVCAEPELWITRPGQAFGDAGFVDIVRGKPRDKDGRPGDQQQDHDAGHRYRITQKAMPNRVPEAA